MRVMVCCDDEKAKLEETIFLHNYMLHPQARGLATGKTQRECRMKKEINLSLIKQSDKNNRDRRNVERR